MFGQVTGEAHARFQDSGVCLIVTLMLVYRYLILLHYATGQLAGGL